MEEEGRVAYIITWYLNRRTFPTCWTPRTVRLTEEVSSWEEQIIETWEDLFTPTDESVLHCVRPTPTQSTLSSHIGHLILEQGPSNEFASIVLTTHRARQHTLLIQQAAHVVPGLLHRSDLLDKAQLRDSEQHLRPFCRIHQGGIPFGIADRRFEPELIESGSSLDIILPSAQPPPSWITIVTSLTLPPLLLLDQGALHFDDTGSSDAIDLMQRSSTGHQNGSRPEAASESGQQPQTATPPANQIATGATHPFCFNANAPAFLPERPAIAAQNEFVQDLHSIWTAEAFSWEGEESSARILTFITDHRFPHLRCDHGRPVRLFEDFTDWERQIRLAWHDLIAPGAPLEYQIVLPQPPQLGPDYAACVVLVQAPREDLVSPLIAIFDGAHRLRVRGRSAVTVHEHIFLEHILFSMGLFDHCFGDAATHQCQAWYQDIPLITGRALPGRSGYGIVLQMQTIQHVTMNRSQDAEGVSLLQRHARLLRSIPVTDEVGEIAAPDENLSDVEARVINLIPGAPMDPLPVTRDLQRRRAERTRSRTTHLWAQWQGHHF